MRNCFTINQAKINTFKISVLIKIQCTSSFIKQEAVITMVTGAQEVIVVVGLEVSVAQVIHST